MKKVTKKTLVFVLILFGLEIAFLIAENTFYQYVDNEGILHESMFMPLGVLSIVVGILFLLFFLMQQVRYWYNKK